MYKGCLMAAFALILCAGVVDASAQAACNVEKCATLRYKVARCSVSKRLTSRQLKRHCLRRRAKVYNRECAVTDMVCFELFMPVCGEPPICCPHGMFCTASIPRPVTYSNSCFMEAAGASFLYDGECR